MIGEYPVLIEIESIGAGSSRCPPSPQNTMGYSKNIAIYDVIFRAGRGTIRTFVLFYRAANNFDPRKNDFLKKRARFVQGGIRIFHERNRGFLVRIQGEEPRSCLVDYDFITALLF